VAHFLSIALSFPSVVYTVLLAAAIVYWLSVLAGAVHFDGGAEGALDGPAEGALDAPVHGAAEHADVADGHGALSGMMAALKLRSAPATVVLSCLALFSWLLCMLGTEAAEAWLPADAFAIARYACFLLAPVLALLPTSAAVRPLARIFVPAAAASHGELVGKVCTIRTGTVTDKFGEAVLDDGGAGLVVKVRIETAQELRRGDQAVIVGYDEARQEFTVASMRAALDDDPGRPGRGRR
jgi:hypothetical protein